MQDVFQVLKERGFIEQSTHENEIQELLKTRQVTFYTGFDPTADSLTIGHFLPLMAMAHMQRAGHRPIALVGGGTALVGDPSGKTDLRRMQTMDETNANAERFKGQLSRLLDFSPGKALMVNNAEWLTKLNYLDFLRTIGVHFSVNRMLGAECYKSRLESGLTFLEFNYMIMQSYDFLELHERFGCDLQLGGNDQWSNILGGVDLIRRVKRTPAFGLTFTLLCTGSGQKMGKTEAGAVWLDPEKTSPYEFFQYLRNVDDGDVGRFLGLLTFLPMEEVKRLGSLEGAALNAAKETLAFEVTKIVHGEEEAEKALQASLGLFGGGAKEGAIPKKSWEKKDLPADLISFLQSLELCTSRSEARRLISQGGIYLNGETVADLELKLTEEHFPEGKLLLRKGKKVFVQVELHSS